MDGNGEMLIDITQIRFTVTWRHAFLVARLRHPIVQIGHHFDFQVLHHLHTRHIGGVHLVGHVAGGEGCAYDVDC